MNVKNLFLKKGDFSLENISFDIPAGKTAVILGPSGAGKSLLLEALAGFYQLASGQIFVAGKNITTLKPEERNVGFMFQDYALFPHYNVKQNILFSARFKKKKTSMFSLEYILNLLHITHLQERSIHDLSGGERQRVALARALYSEPEFFLFDEPMAALDRKLKKELCLEFRNILHQMNCTTLYVTHDQLEAGVLGDLVFLMEEGNLIQKGTWKEIYNYPAVPAAARLIGIENIFLGTVIAAAQNREYWQIFLSGSSQTLTVKSSDCFAVDEIIQIGIADESIFFHWQYEVESEMENVLTVKIQDIVPWENFLYRLTLTGMVPLIKYLPQSLFAEKQMVIGHEIKIYIPMNQIYIWHDN